MNPERGALVKGSDEPRVTMFSQWPGISYVAHAGQAYDEQIFGRRFAENGQLFFTPLA